MCVNKQLLVPTDFLFPPYYLNQVVNVDQQLFGYPHSSKYLLLCSGQEYKLIQVWYNMTESK